ncbi:MAG: DUF2304 domain-containing protein [Solirubrobacteraceae bacterium]
MSLSSTHLSPPLSQRVEVVIVAVAVCAVIFELVRRRRLMERYAILWLVAGLAVLVLGLWQGLLSTLAHAVGIYYTPSALFAVTFLFVLVLLVHFSLTVSRLSDQNTTLAQRVALLQQRLEGERQGPVEAPHRAGDRAGAGAAQGATGADAAAGKGDPAGLVGADPPSGSAGPTPPPTAPA